MYQTPSHASLCIKEVLDGKKLSLRCHSQLSLLRLSHAYEETMATSQSGEYESSATQLHVTLESVLPGLVSHFVSELTGNNIFGHACGTVAFISSECESLINKNPEIDGERTEEYCLLAHSSWPSNYSS